MENCVFLYYNFFNKNFYEFNKNFCEQNVPTH